VNEVARSRSSDALAPLSAIRHTPLGQIAMENRREVCVIVDRILNDEIDSNTVRVAAFNSSI
jgi:hypothetical protein